VETAPRRIDANGVRGWLHLPSPGRAGRPAAAVAIAHDAKDQFGSIAEMEAARALIPAPTRLHIVERASHRLPPSIAASLPEWLAR
jgi:hypothetical protein